MASSAPFVSSLRASLASTATAASLGPSAPALQPSGATTNPFAALPAASLASAVESRKQVMSAFSELDLALDASLADAGGRSAARELLDRKRAETQAEQRAEAERLQAKRPPRAQPSAPARPPSALDQALDAFDGEAQALQPKSKASLSRRARQKKERARQRAEGYEGRHGAGRSRGGVLRRRTYAQL